MKKLYKQWVDTCANAGLKPMSDDNCCRLLAIVYVYGGNSEAFTHNHKLTTDIEYAQERLNIGGAKFPDAELLPILQRYIKELEADEKTASYDDAGSYVFDKHRKSFAVGFMKDKYNIDIK